MTSARETILRRIGTALTDRPDPPVVVRDYRPARGPGDGDLLIERLEDYQAHTARAGEDVRGVLARVLAGAGVRTVVVPDGFPVEWLPDMDVLREPLTNERLDGADAVLTTCAVAISETATIVLDAGAGMGRRALTLLPDHHIVVVRRDQIVASVPDAVAALDPTRPLTWISGPSATSDIELSRVEGVHGPRHLHVVVVDDHPLNIKERT